MGVRRLWGVEDTQAFVGRLFRHPIPKDAFQGQVESYQVKGLPAWLSWNAAQSAVEGVARPSDRGHHYVTVRARGVDGSRAKDVFAVEVVPLPGSVLTHEGGRCGGGRAGGRGGRSSDVTILTVLLRVHLSTLPAPRRLQVLREANNFMARNASFIPAPHDADPLADDAALQAGPGSSTLTSGRDASSPLRSLSQLQWAVGCGGDVTASAQPALDRVEAAARNGDLEKLLGLPVLGWHVTRVNPTSNRVRRQADYSGDYGEEGDGDGGGDDAFYDSDYSYNYDYDDYIYGGPLGESDDVESIDYGAEPVPETRVIPSLATPSFPEPSSVPSSASVPLASRVHPDSALHFSPVLVSTPVYVPEKPSRILEASPTVTYETAYPTDLPYPSLEGSMTNQPTSVISSTTPLTITPVTTQPVAPTTVRTHTETESAVKNYPPRIKNRIQKVAWVAGHVYRLPIPADTFEDFEDGDTRNLKLIFKTSQNLNIGHNSWIQFDPSNQEIYALPLEQDIGRYSYFLEAMDSEGKTITDTVIIHVQQPREGRNFNHRFTAVFTPEKKYDYEFVYSLDWQIRVVEKLAHLYGDATTGNINVRSISENPNKLTWTNTSLANSRSTFCPADELEAVAEVVVSGDDHGMTREVKEAFKPEFHLKRVHLHYLGPCEELRPSKPAVPRPPIAPPEENVDAGGDGDTFNREPIIRNPIDLLNATQGSLFRFQVPQDTCYDLEDGNSHRLRMRLLTSMLADVPLDSWLQFDVANHEFYGIPLADDVGKTEYNLECVDSGGKKIIDALFVSVTRRPSRGLPAAQFDITIQKSFREFNRDAQLKAKLVERIAQAFGDPDPTHIAIDAITDGSVVVSWHNTSLPSDPCPEEELRKLREVMLDSDGQLLRSFVESFAPEYTVTSGRLTPAGVCLGGDTPTHIEEEEHKPGVSDNIEGEDNEYLINFIIPAVIIAAMLFLAAIIACCLYHRRRYGKMTMADDRTFVSKGIPIIFAEELDDRPDPAKSPVIMKEEKPPLPPPEYQRGSPAAPATPPNTDRRRPNSGHEGGDDTPSYQPPPPFTATNGASRHPRPNMPPTYRKPPTYVPP